MPDFDPRNRRSNVTQQNRSASGGVNTFSSPLDIKDDQVVDMTNGIASVPGILRIRPGSSVIATSASMLGPVLAMSEFTPSSFTPELLLVTPGAAYPTTAHLQLWKWDGSSANFTKIGALTGMTAATLPVDIITGLDLNAPGGPAIAKITSKQGLGWDYIYAGSALTAVSGGKVLNSGAWPFGTAVGRGFEAGRTGATRGTIYYSDVASYTVTGMSTLQGITLGGGTRQETVALKEFRSSDLVIFQSDRIEVLVMNGDPLASLVGTLSAAGLWSRQVIDKKIGCCSRRTVQTVGEDLLFGDQYGNIRSLAQTITDNNQGIKRLPVSAPIQSFIDRINPSAFDAIVAEAYDRYYVVCFPLDNAVTPSHTFLYDTINDAWYGPHDGIVWGAASSMAIATLITATTLTDRNPTLYVGGASTANSNGAQVYRTFVGNGDNGAVISMQETTKRYSGSALEVKKRPSRARVYALPSAGATLMAEARPDGGAYQFLGYKDLSGSSPQLPLTGPIDFTGSGVVESVFALESIDPCIDLQLRLTVTANGDVQILGHTIEALIDNVDDTPNP